MNLKMTLFKDLKKFGQIVMKKENVEDNQSLLTLKRESTEKQDSL